MLQLFLEPAGRDPGGQTSLKPAPGPLGKVQNMNWPDLSVRGPNSIFHQLFPELTVRA